MATESILYISTHTKSPGRQISGNTITYRLKKRFPNRGQLSLLIAMVELRVGHLIMIECRELLTWTSTQVDGVWTHVINTGDIIGSPVEANDWIQSCVGKVANDHTSNKSKFRAGWGLNMFATGLVSLERYGMLPKSYIVPENCYTPLQNQLFKITNNRNINSGVIRFKFFERAGIQACVFEAIDCMPDDHDVFSIYAECENIREFANYLTDVYSEQYSAEHDDYQITDTDISNLIDPSKGKLKRVYAKTEKKVEAWLISRGFTVVPQKSFDWCRKKLWCRFDFLVITDNKKHIIEVDGPQHFVDHAHFKTTAVEVQLNDRFKAECVLNRSNYDIIRLDQEGVWRDSFDWRQATLDVMDRWNNEHPTIYYLSGDAHKYDQHRAMFPLDG